MKTRRLRLPTLMVWVLILGVDFSLWVNFDLSTPTLDSPSTWSRQLALSYVIFSLIAMGVGVAWHGGWDDVWRRKRAPTREEHLAMVRASLRFAPRSLGENPGVSSFLSPEDIEEIRLLDK